MEYLKATNFSGLNRLVFGGYQFQRFSDREGTDGSEGEGTDGSDEGDILEIDVSNGTKK